MGRALALSKLIVSLKNPLVFLPSNNLPNSLWKIFILSTVPVSKILDSIKELILSNSALVGFL